MTTIDLRKVLQLSRPIFVAPMAGGPSSVDLVSESANAGALGFMGAAYTNGAAIVDFATKVRAKTTRPFGINLFIPHPQPVVSAADVAAAIDANAGFRMDLGLPKPHLNPPYEEIFEGQIEAVLRVRPAAFSFVFGMLAPHYMKTLGAAGIFRIGTATTLDEALELQDFGVDAIVLQGVEAGGHRGIFDPAAPDKEVPLQTLLATCSSKIKCPLIAAGGIMTADDIRNALASGASAVQMGTAFLACREAGTSAVYREKLLESSTRVTRTTRVFSGRIARGIENRYMREMKGRPVLPFPAQNKFTRDLRMASAAKGSPEFLSLWAGSGAGKLWTGSVNDLLKTLWLD